LYIHLPTPIDAPCDIEQFRPEEKDAAAIPADLLEASKEYFNKDSLWFPENRLYAQTMEEEEVYPYGLQGYEHVWFMVKSNWDVFTNLQSTEDWWKLGNLKDDPVEVIISRFENNSTFGLQTVHTYSPRKLAEQYGNPESEKIFTSKESLLCLYLSKYFQEQKGDNHAA